MISFLAQLFLIDSNAIKWGHLLKFGEIIKRSRWLHMHVSNCAVIRLKSSKWAQKILMRLFRRNHWDKADTPKKLPSSGSSRVKTAKLCGLTLKRVISEAVHEMPQIRRFRWPNMNNHKYAWANKQNKASWFSCLHKIKHLISLALPHDTVTAPVTINDV